MGNKSVKFHQLSPGLTDIWQNSKFTLEEIMMWYDDFKGRYPTGSITLPEFQKLYSELCPTGDCNDLASHVFRLYDTDANGVLSFREFIYGISMTSAQNPKSRIEWIFKLYDLDKDGYITEAEMVQVLQAIFKMNPNPTFDLTIKLPLDSEEKISPEKITKRLFEKYNGSGTGKLSKDELLQSALDDPYLSKLLS